MRISRFAGSLFCPPVCLGATAVVLVLASCAWVACAARAQDVPDGGVPADGATPTGADAGPVTALDADGGAGVTPDADAGTADAGAPRARVIVVDVAAYPPVDPVVGTFVSRALREGASALGYDVISAEDTVAAAQQHAMPYPPSPADLWRVTTATGALRGVFATVGAFQGQYVVEITVASADGGGPFVTRGSAPSETLLGVVADLLRQVLPPPDVSTAPGVTSTYPPTNVTPPPTPIAPVTPITSHVRQTHHGTGHARHWALVGIVDAAFGLSQDFFFNFLAGARLDYRITQDIRIGVGALGGLLRGKTGIAGNVLFLAQIEDRLRIASDSDVLVPLRLALGYLPYNGPFVRVAAGVSIPFANSWEVTFDVLAADFWILADRTVVSMDLAVELGARF